MSTAMSPPRAVGQHIHRMLWAALGLVLWVVSGFVFGYLYSKLPGRIGPLKALTFAAIWIAGGPRRRRD